MNPSYIVLVHVVWFLSTYFIVLFMLLLIENRKKLYVKQDSAYKEEFVSIIVPAYNEEGTIEDAIESLKKIDYPKDKFEIVVVNDGSSDNTSNIVKLFVSKQVRFIDNPKNKGKAACLNQGIDAAKGSVIATMDADTVVPKNIFKEMMPYLNDPSTGAVTVSVEVRFVRNFLQRIIQLEYILGLSLFLKVFSLLNCVHVTPGPFSIYRKDLLQKIGGFDEKNITEDLEIAYRIHKSGNKIANCLSTSVKTITPHDFKGLYRQRKRWYSGALMTMWKHRDMMLRSKSGLFGFFVPFNWALVTFGLGLFLLSLTLIVSDAFGNLLLYSLINYNFFSNWTWSFDYLAISMMAFFALSGIIGMIILVTYGLNVARNSPKKTPKVYLGYFLLFFLYQFFWLVSYFAVLTRRKVRW